MRANRIIVASPVFNQYLSFAQRCEDFAIQEFVPELRVQALTVAILPWATRLDIERLDADPAEPVSYIFGDELGTVVRANVLRWAVRDEEIGQTLEHIIGSQSSRDDDCQTPARELIQHDQHAEGAAVLGPVLDEVVRPDVVRTLRSETDARPIVEPQTAPLGCLLGTFSPSRRQMR